MWGCVWKKKRGGARGGEVDGGGGGKGPLSCTPARSKKNQKEKHTCVHIHTDAACVVRLLSSSPVRAYTTQAQAHQKKNGSDRKASPNSFCAQSVRVCCLSKQTPPPPPNPRAHDHRVREMLIMPSSHAQVAALFSVGLFPFFPFAAGPPDSIRSNQTAARGAETRTLPFPSPLHTRHKRHAQW